MKWTGLNELREQYLAFFEEKGHLRLASYPLVPGGDSSLLLINSGMAPMKNYFMGVEVPPRVRVTTCQKCIRTPDIERVGKTSRHGTFFEMLGNFSFGDYFKYEACAWAWEFVTQKMRMPLDKLWVSIYLDDDQAARIWTNEVGVAADRIVRLGKEDNFWEIGTGPCGPCSEIYFDRGPEKGCGSPDCAVGCDCDRFVEFWNLVFTQFDSDGKGGYTPLAKPNIDTGMGLERLACIMQGVDSLFDTDTIQNIMSRVAEIAGVKYGADEKTDIALRVITDHIRSTVFMVGDGVMPQNEGRGYVLRRLIRRAARFGRMLGIQKAFLHKVCEQVVEENKAAYPELDENLDYIRQVIKLEEERFQKTLSSGMEILSGLIAETPAGGVLSGEEVFRLYDTFGFPVDLTREIAEDGGLSIDQTGFEQQMKLQRERARKAHLEHGGVGWEEDALAGEYFEDEFLGYSLSGVKTHLTRIVKDGKLTESVGAGESAFLLLGQTPFYAESGGQVGDSGRITAKDAVFIVEDTKKSPSGHTLHIGRVSAGNFSVGQQVNGEIDVTRRRAITRNHTAAHLLQAALREILGSHVHQAGQMVDENTCRFDFSHFEGMKPDEIAKVEARVNELILAALPATDSEMDIDAAKEKGALALFGSKYADTVRVVDIAGESIELCGGCHVSSTAEVGLFKILHESSVAAGVRRIEAVTGQGLLGHFDEQEALIKSACEVLKLGFAAELPEKLAALAGQVRTMQKQVDEFERRRAAMLLGEFSLKTVHIGGVRLLKAKLEFDKDISLFKEAEDNMKAQYPDMVGVAAIIAPDKKVSLRVFAGKDATKAGVHAGKLVSALAKLAGGSGGGRPDSAMGGVADIDKVDQVIAAVPEVLQAQLDGN